MTDEPEHQFLLLLVDGEQVDLDEVFGLRTLAAFTLGRPTDKVRVAGLLEPLPGPTDTIH